MKKQANYENVHRTYKSRKRRYERIKKKAGIFLSTVMIVTAVIGQISVVFADSTATTKATASAKQPVPKVINLSIEGAYEAFDKGPGGDLATIEGKKEYGSYKALSQNYSSLIKSGGRDTYEADKLRLARNHFYDVIERNKEARKVNNRIQTFELYFNYKHTKNNVLMAEKRFKIAEKQYEIAKLKYNAGLTSKLDMLNADKSFSSSKKDLETAKNSLQTMKNKFNRYMGFDLNQEVNLISNVAVQTLPEKKVGEIIAEAKKNGIFMSEAEYNLKQAQIAFAEVGAYPRDSTAYIDAKNNLDLAEINMKSKPATLESEIQEKYDEMMRRYDAVRHEDDALVLARKQLRIAQVTFSAGLNLRSDVENAELAVSAAEMALEQAIMSYNVAAIKYETSGVAGLG